MSEKNKKTILAYALITGKSAKEVSEYFTSEYQGIEHAVSEARVGEILNEFSKKSIEEQTEFINFLDRTKEELTDEVKARIDSITILALQNKSVGEIAEELNLDYFTVYKDIIVNTKKINPTLSYVLQTKTNIIKGEEIDPFDRFPFKKTGKR